MLIKSQNLIVYLKALISLMISLFFASSDCMRSRWAEEASNPGLESTLSLPWAEDNTPWTCYLCIILHDQVFIGHAKVLLIDEHNFFFILPYQWIVRDPVNKAWNNSNIWKQKISTDPHEMDGSSGRKMRFYGFYGNTENSSTHMVVDKSFVLIPEQVLHTKDMGKQLVGQTCNSWLERLNPPRTEAEKLSFSLLS